MPRMMIEVDEDEGRALQKLAQRERRSPQSQAALLVRRELVRLGLIDDQLVNVPMLEKSMAGEIPAQVGV